jgi:hypothetical protein
MCIMSCTRRGTASVVRNTTRTQDTLDEFGESEGLEFAAMAVKDTKKPYQFIKIPTAVAGAIVSVDTTGVTGTAQVSFAGANDGPYDDEEFVFEVVDGFTIGTAGGSFKLSRDGGRTWTGKLRAGTATNYTHVGAGIAVTFGAVGRTLVAGDRATARARGPMWDSAGLAAAFAALAQQPTRPRIVCITGEMDAASDVQSVIDQVAAFESTHKKHTVAFCSLRDRYEPCAMQKPAARMTGAPSDLDFVAAADTITRNTGSWVDDGFVVGMSVTIAGTASNNGVKGLVVTVTATVLTLASSPGLVDEANVNGAAVTITGISPGDLDFAASGHTITRNIGSWVTDGFKVGMTVTVDGTASNDGVVGVLTNVSATVLTFGSGVVDESNLPATGVSITATETKTQWRAALETIVGATPQTQKQDFRILASGGRAMGLSEVDNLSRKRRPFWWAIAIRCMQHDVHVSPAQVDLGGLTRWTIFDDAGNLQEHDERTDGGLLAARIACATTLNEFAGTYVALPLTLDEDNKPLSRLPIVLVGQLACATAQRAYTLKLNSFVGRKPSGVITEGEARRIEGGVRTALNIALMQAGPEGPRATFVDTTLARDVDLRVQGAQVPWTVDVRTYGYLEQLPGTVRIGG